MFFRLFIYNIKRQLRTKELVFWNLCFSLILGTLFSVTFGGNMEKSELLRTIPVAYVTAEGEEEGFGEVLESLSEDEDPLIAVMETDWEEGKNLLDGDEVEGIFYHADGEITLYVREEGINQSVLEMILEQYLQQSAVTRQIAMEHPENLAQVLDGMTEEISMLYEEKYTDGPMDPMNGYFYALIAMSCLYGCFGGLNYANDHKADLSALAARRAISSTNRFVAMTADILSYIMEVFLFTMISVFYLKYVMQMNFGSKMPQMMCVVFMGSFIGVATGFFIGSLGHVKRETKRGIAIAITMFECFLSGLMVGNMYHIIQDICPLLNKINPAALIVDALYSLDIYSDYTRFFQNMGILGIFAVALCIASWLLIRRERYASI